MKVATKPYQNLVFVDTETTGYNSKHDRIIEIAVFKVENGELAETFTTLVNPNQYVPEFIENYTGINVNELEIAPSFDQIADKLIALMDGSIFVAHNVNFDLGFLQNEFLRAGFDFNPHKLCTVKLTRRLYPTLKKYNLTNIISNFNFECNNRHRAYDDAHVLWQLYQKALNDFGEDNFSATLTACVKNSNVPALLDEAVVENLPDDPGVYIFYGKNELPLYIGKSINIKKRVKSHFASKFSTREQNLHEQICDIKALTTSGELSALMLESKMIKEMLPVFNQRLRRKTEMVILKSYSDKDGYLRTNYERTKKISKFEAENILGVFDSLKECKETLTKMAEEHNLCCKLLGLENAMNACFRYHLGKCKGACVKKEAPDDYNARFMVAFDRNLIDPWPFDGAIKITERLSKNSSTFVVDKWCLLEENGLAANSAFDQDVYRILKDYIFKNRDGVEITVLSAVHD